MTGPTGSLCYPDAVPGGPEEAPSRTRIQSPMPFINGIGAPELIIILVIALIVVGPGRAAGCGLRAGQEHPRVPQGGDRRQGRHQPRGEAAVRPRSGRCRARRRHRRPGDRRRSRPPRSHPPRPTSRSCPSRCTPRTSSPRRRPRRPASRAPWPTPTPSGTPAFRSPAHPTRRLIRLSPRRPRRRVRRAPR